MSARPQGAQMLGQRRARLERRLGIPARPKTADRSGAADWMDSSRCATAPEADRLAFVRTGLTQADAWPLIAAYCARCPVADDCLADARRSHLHGLAGGFVLADGHLAPDAPGHDAYTSPAAWIAPWDREEAAS